MSMTFGSRIRMLRLDAGLSQQAFGEAVGFSKQAINGMENDRRQTVADKIGEIAIFFSVPADFLLGNPPFDQWELVMEHRGEITEAIASELSFLGSQFVDRLRAASLPQFIAYVGALLSRIVFNPEDNSFSLVLRLDQ